MKKAVFCILFLILFFIPQSAYAHFTETDGPIAVTLHIDPNDNPIPGKKANLYFLFTDKTKAFHIIECNCTVIVTEQGKQIFQKPLSEQKSSHLSVWGTYIPMVFPHNDSYHISLTGKPQMKGSFPSFSVSWDFRVDPKNPGIIDDDDVKPSGLSDIQMLIGAWVLGILVLAGIGIFFKKQVLSSDTVGK